MSIHHSLGGAQTHHPPCSINSWLQAHVLTTTNWAKIVEQCWLGWWIPLLNVRFLSHLEHLPNILGVEVSKDCRNMPCNTEFVLIGMAVEFFTSLNTIATNLSPLKNFTIFCNNHVAVLVANNNGSPWEWDIFLTIFSLFKMLFSNSNWNWNELRKGSNWWTLWLSNWDQENLTTSVNASFVLDFL